MSNSSTFTFRITSFLAGGVIETKDYPIRLVFPDMPPVELYASKGDDAEQWVLTALCDGFVSEAEAKAVGSRVKMALVLAGILLGVGIDAGDDQIIGSPLRPANGQPDERLQPEVHGLQVVPNIEGLRFGSLRFGRPVTRISTADLQKRVAESYGLKKPLTKKQILAAQLYNESHFHPSDAARFIVLISAVEALVEQNSRASAVLKLIDQMLEMIKVSMNPDEFETQSLIGSLSKLKKESIGAACRALVRKHCGDSAARAFAHRYTIRSTMLHTGEPPARTDFEVEVRELDTLVRTLLVRNISSLYKSP